MNIIEALNWRYAVREFSPEKISRPEIVSLLEAARLSASSYGLQPYKILVLEDDKERQALLQYSYGQSKVVESSHLLIFAAETSIGDHTVDQYIAQSLKIRSGDSEIPNDYVNHMKAALAMKSDTEKRAWAREQVYIALGTLLTAASTLRIDTCPMTGFDTEGYNKVLGLSKAGLSATAICAVGRRSKSDTTAFKSKIRRSFNDLVQWQEPVSP